MNNLFILFGATGDLSIRKIIPALYTLYKSGNRFVVIGIARDAVDVVAQAIPYIDDYDEAIGKAFRSCIHMHVMDVTQHEKWKELEQLCARLAPDLVRIAYLATPASLFCAITTGVGMHGIVRKDIDRIVYEKPFGSDGITARVIQECITQWFDESQVYRIDHYLTKEIVGSLALLRFTNSIFEPLWNAQYIESVHIILSEQLGIEGRVEYYDAYGVIKDVVQNHMLQQLALIAMEEPADLTGVAIQRAKAAVLEKTRYVSGVFGQYAGYEAEVGHASKTPTFALLTCAVDTKRWAGVPFYLSTGKRLSKKQTLISIRFKTTVCALPELAACLPNVLTLFIEPQSGFSLAINTKRLQEKYQIMPVELSYCQSCIFPHTPQAYSVLLQEICSGDQSVSVSFAEIVAAWKVVDGIIVDQLYIYEPGSNGPE